MDRRNESGGRLSILMLPWLAYGHISPFLELAKKLTIKNFHIYLCSTLINFNHIKKNIPENYSQSIELVELNLPPLPNPSYPHHHTTNGLPCDLLPSLKEAYEMSSPAFAAILEKIRPDLLIYDFNQWWAADEALKLKIPCVQFLLGSAACFSFSIHFFTKPLDEKYPFPEIHLKDYERARIQKAFVSRTLDETRKNPRMLDQIRNQIRKNALVDCISRSCGIVLIKSVSELEEKYIHYLSEMVAKKMVTTGALVQECPEDQDEHKEVIQWLNKKEQSSVVFVSFGSESFLSKEEIEDIAYGLELSNVNFIWVIRFPEGKEISLEEVLPDKYIERVGDRGLVMEKWAPQAKILSHLSTGGFLSHCGWSSVMESIHYCVPIIAMPMQHDQPFNSRVAEENGVAIGVSRDENGRLKREEIAAVVRKVMVDKDGASMRKSAKELNESMQMTADEFVDKVAVELVTLCNQGVEKQMTT